MFGAGPAAFSLPHDFASRTQTEQHRLVWKLGGAVVQHAHARAVSRLFKGPKPSYRDATHMARRWGVRPKPLRLVLNGTTLMQPEDVALFIRLTGSDGQIDPSELRSILTGISQQAHAISGFRPAPGLPMSRVQEDVSMALGGEHIVTVAAPWTDAERAGHARNLLLASAPLAEAVQTLRRTPGRLPESRWHQGDENDIEVEPRRAGWLPVAVGAVHDCGVDVIVWLPVDWAATVHDRGLALVDGWFVAAVAGGTPERPTIAHVLDMPLLSGAPGLGEDDEPLGRWEFAIRRSALTWDGTGRAHIAG